jgi:hypothetical protein
MQGGELFPTEELESGVDNFQFQLDPYTDSFTGKVKVSCCCANFGITVMHDQINGCGFVKSVSAGGSISKIWGNHTRPPTTRSLGHSSCASMARKSSPKKISLLPLLSCVKVGPQSLTSSLHTSANLKGKELWKVVEEHDLFNPDAIDEDEEHVHTLTFKDICAITSIWHPDIDFSIDALPTDELGVIVHAIQSHAITPEEQALGSFTHHKLKKLDTWPLWAAGEQKQLNHFHSLQMYGDPVNCTHLVPLSCTPHWQYSIKCDGTCIGPGTVVMGPCAAPVLHGVASTYSSCVEQPVQWLFFALAAQMGYKVYGGDATDAFAHSPPPEQPTFVAIDDAYAEWYEHTFGKVLDQSQVLPVLHALQGHPKSGCLWEVHIGKIL